MGEESNNLSTELDHLTKIVKFTHMLNNDSHMFYKTEDPIEKKKKSDFNLISQSCQWFERHCNSTVNSRPICATNATLKQ